MEGGTALNVPKKGVEYTTFRTYWTKMAHHIKWMACVGVVPSGPVEWQVPAPSSRMGNQRDRECCRVEPIQRNP